MHDSCDAYGIESLREGLSLPNTEGDRRKDLGPRNPERFKTKKSTLQNINDLVSLIKEAKTHTEAEMKITKVVKNRARVLLVLFDFK